MKTVKILVTKLEIYERQVMVEIPALESREAMENAARVAALQYKGRGRRGTFRHITDHNPVVWKTEML
jgi:hypothetical protein